MTKLKEKPSNTTMFDKKEACSLKDLPFVSVVVPVRNEEKFIGKCVESLLNGTYPKDKLEILVVDGMSEDETRKIVERYERKYPHVVKLLKNEKLYTPCGLNIGIKNSRGDIVMVAGAHTTFSENYIEECVKRLLNNCDVAGGIVKTLPRDDKPISKAIASVLKHPFGVGGAKYRIKEDLKEDIEVDTVAYGLYKKEIFDKVGLFNEKLIRNQDIELNHRIKRSGGKIILVPSAQAFYYARNTLKSLWKNNFENGFWVIWSLKFAKLPFSIRHVVPLAFILFLIFGFLLSFLWGSFAYFFGSVIGLYIILLLISSFQIALKLKNFMIFFCSIISFLTLHISYGLGSLWALIKWEFVRG